MKATEETRKKFESIYREYGYNSMKEFADAAGLNYANLSRVMNGKQSEGSILLRIAKFLGVSYDGLRRTCGFCGVEGENILNSLDEEFQTHRGNNSVTVVGNNNATNNNVYGKDTASQLAALKSEIENLKRVNEVKEKQIEQLQKDKAFLQNLLEKR